MTTPPPGQALTAETVKLLVKGDWLMRDEEVAVQFARRSELNFIREIGGRVGRSEYRYTFIGRPDADGWIAWHGMGFAEWMRGLTVETKTRKGHVRTPSSTENVAWQYIVGFRIAEQSTAPTPSEPVASALADGEGLEVVAVIENLTLMFSEAGKQRAFPKRTELVTAEAAAARIAQIERALEKTASDFHEAAAALDAEKARADRLAKLGREAVEELLHARTDKAEDLGRAFLEALREPQSEGGL